MIADEIGKVLDLQKRAGGWGAYVSTMAPGLSGADRDAVVDMLTKRAALLEEKRTELLKPPAPPPAPGQARYTAKQYSTVLPSASIKIEHLPETHVLTDHYGKIDRSYPKKTTSGEEYNEYIKRAREATKAIPSDAMSGIKAFTGSSYGSIRSSEERGQPDSRSNAIQKAFKVATPEPGTVFRGIQGLPYAVIEQHLRASGFIQLGKGNTGATSSTSWMIDVSVDSFMGGASDSYSKDQYKILYKINHKTGIPVEHVSSVGSTEHEILLARDARFRITGLSRAAGTQRVLVVELEEDDPNATGAAPAKKPRAPRKKKVI